MQFLRYLIVGVINTVIGYGVFVSLVEYLNLIPELANLIGYFFALTVAYILNKNYVFSGYVVAPNSKSRFILSFIASFFVNQCALIFLYRYLGISAVVAQIPAMICYTLVFYFLNRKFVFNIIYIASNSK
jgi:putative flippase GtrA